ncbi:MAG: hypothetical protein ACD_4C00442G0001 [uncultured bacterium (gcode 4)]|uniref:Uncharacterized protein n=1 Tax=uncultured bacterium (gcode 4) TaxID=1234023 RepID=K2FW26_9BACT|nr:MAG: hypothetical protein ACD_4C00442G0001 [uncultured bacterium (gcode 4)]
MTAMIARLVMISTSVNQEILGLDVCFFFFLSKISRKIENIFFIWKKIDVKIFAHFKTKSL